MLFWNARARNTHVEATLNHPFPAQVDPVDWEKGDHIFVTSTTFDALEAEERFIESVSEDGRTVELTQRLYFDHHGDGYLDAEGEDLVPEYRAEVGLLTRNVVVQGDDVSKRQQFGCQIVFASSQIYDNSIIGRLSNVEVRQTGQGLKLGKYPIHFHMVGNVDKSPQSQSLRELGQSKMILVPIYDACVCPQVVREKLQRPLREQPRHRDPRRE